ncbi:MAG: PaaX domain-containing protein, C- domain protein [Microthrixaceae bacterium]
MSTARMATARMAAASKSTASKSTADATERFGPPLSARSVVASVLLGTEPPVMAPRALVRAGELFGLAEGTVRTALSRMTSAGELERDDTGRYRLVGHLVERQRLQQASREPQLREWGGVWEMWVVESTGRAPAQRADLRLAARSLRLAELRDGVWLRPDNLSRPSRDAPSGGPGGSDKTAGSDGAAETMATQARRFVAYPDRDDELASELWDLDGWDSAALKLRREMHSVARRLQDPDAEALRDGFVLAAAVLRQFNSDPLLPVELCGPNHQGRILRADFDSYDATFRKALRMWLAPEATMAAQS